MRSPLMIGLEYMNTDEPGCWFPETREVWHYCLGVGNYRVHYYWGHHCNVAPGKNVKIRGICRCPSRTGQKKCPAYIPWKERREHVRSAFRKYGLEFKLALFCRDPRRFYGPPC